MQKAGNVAQLSETTKKWESKGFLKGFSIVLIGNIIQTIAFMIYICSQIPPNVDETSFEGKMPLFYAFGGACFFLPFTQFIHIIPAAIIACLKKNRGILEGLLITAFFTFIGAGFIAFESMMLGISE